MIELLLTSVIVGKIQISPTVVQLDYLTSSKEIVTVLDNIKSTENKD